MEIIEPAPIENGVVQRLRKGCFMNRSPVTNEIIYRLKSSEIWFTIYNILITQKSSLPDKRIIDLILSNIENRDTLKDFPNLPKRINSLNGAIDSVIETTYEILPHPYHA